MQGESKSLRNLEFRDTAKFHSKEQPMLAVPAFQLLCFCVTLFVFGGDIGMQLVFAGPVSWGFVTFALACVLANGFLLFRKAKWLH